MHLQNITFVTLGGTDLFMTFWVVLSLILYIKFREREKHDKYLLLLVSVVSFSLSMLSKETGIAFVLSFPLIEHLMKRRALSG
jgi:4-amino-4-deoxy-L-arabinose transferase-like glycosyltransferase